METLIDAQEVYSIEGLSLWYDKTQALKDVNVGILENRVMAIIGPSGCGKSTFLKTLNRMIDIESKVTIKGQISYRGHDLYNERYPVEELRHRVGMVFQKANPFPKSIYNNIAFGPRLRGIKGKQLLNEIVEKSLRQAALWDEVKDKLNQDAHSLSGGQQQRLCLARCLAVDPDVILMDEPTSALDPIATAKIEELIYQLQQQYSIIIVTHNMEQAKRVSDQTAFFLNGKLIEQRETNDLFDNPLHEETADYISGRFG